MLVELEGPTDRLVVQGTFETTPARLFQYWVEPALLAEWWAPGAEIDLRVGGLYTLSWPAMGWCLRGTYSVVESGERLAFTWAWDHEPELPERAVDVRFVADAAGTVMTIEQGIYRDLPEDVADRQSHLEGWLHFGERLATAVAK